MALAIVAVVSTLALAEILLRAWPREPPREGLRALHQVRPDRPWIYGLRPGAETSFALPDADRPTRYRINEDGFRDRRFTRFRQPGVTRIVVLGDSVAFGYGIDRRDTFPKQMERMLGSGVEVLNLAVNGYNPYTQAALFADLGADYQPDLVLVQFCTNDLNDPTLHFDAQTKLHFQAIPDAAFPDPSVRAQSPAVSVSAFASCRGLLLCELLDDAFLALRPDADPRSQLLALVSHDSMSEEVADWLGDRYSEIADRARAIDASFAVIAFPDRNQIQPGGRGRLQRELVMLGEERGWLTIDLWPAFAVAAAEDEETLFLDVWHPSAHGHHVAADAIVEGLKAAELIPNDGPSRSIAQ